MPTVKLSLKQLAQRALETPSLTQGYQFKPVDGVVEVLDGWTASVGLAFAHDKIRSPVIHDIVQQRCRDVAFVSSPQLSFSPVPLLTKSTDCRVYRVWRGCIFVFASCTERSGTSASRLEDSISANIAQLD